MSKGDKMRRKQAEEKENKGRESFKRREKQKHPKTPKDQENQV